MSVPISLHSVRPLFLCGPNSWSQSARAKVYIISACRAGAEFVMDALQFFVFPIPL